MKNKMRMDGGKEQTAEKPKLPGKGMCDGIVLDRYKGDVYLDASVSVGGYSVFYDGRSPKGNCAMISVLSGGDAVVEGQALPKGGEREFQLAEGKKLRAKALSATDTAAKVELTLEGASAEADSEGNEGYDVPDYQSDVDVDTDSDIDSGYDDAETDSEADMPASRGVYAMMQIFDSKGGYLGTFESEGALLPHAIAMVSTGKGPAVIDYGPAGEARQGVYGVQMSYFAADDPMKTAYLGCDKPQLPSIEAGVQVRISGQGVDAEARPDGDAGASQSSEGPCVVGPIDEADILAMPEAGKAGETPIFELQVSDQEGHPDMLFRATPAGLALEGDAPDCGPETDAGIDTDTDADTDTDTDTWPCSDMAERTMAVGDTITVGSVSFTLEDASKEGEVSVTIRCGADVLAVEMLCEMCKPTTIERMGASITVEPLRKVRAPLSTGPDEVYARITVDEL